MFLFNSIKLIEMSVSNKYMLRENFKGGGYVNTSSLRSFLQKKFLQQKRVTSGYVHFCNN